MKLTYCSTGQSVRREAVQLQLWSNNGQALNPKSTKYK